MLIYRLSMQMTDSYQIPVLRHVKIYDVDFIDKLFSLTQL